MSRGLTGAWGRCFVTQQKLCKDSPPPGVLCAGSSWLLCQVGPVFLHTLKRRSVAIKISRALFSLLFHWLPHKMGRSVKHLIGLQWGEEMGASRGDGKGQKRVILQTNNPGLSWQRHEGVATTPQLWSAGPQVPQDAKITSLLQEKLWSVREGSLSWQGHAAISIPLVFI